MIFTRKFSIDEFCWGGGETCPIGGLEPPDPPGPAGFASEVATTTDAFPPGPLATAQALKSPTAAIEYDDSNHDRFPPGDPSRRAFTYFVLTGGRFIYASAIRLTVLKFVMSMSASKDVLALASLEVDLGSIPVRPPRGCTVPAAGDSASLCGEADERRRPPPRSRPHARRATR